jgi:hypothetical protein
MLRGLVNFTIHKWYLGDKIKTKKSAGFYAHMGEIANAYKVLIRKPEKNMSETWE